jgi:hypothetical protein
MKPGQFLKHKNYLDICLKLTHVFDYGHGYEIKADIWNMAFVESYPLGEKMRLNIAKDEKDIKIGRNTHMSEWLILRGNSTMDKCYRYSKWE